MAGSHVFTGRGAVHLLIIKEHIGTKGFEEIPLAQAAKKEALINTNIPLPQSPHHPLVGRRCTGSYQCRANRTFISGKLSLQTMQGLQEVFKGPGSMGIRAEAFSFSVNASRPRSLKIRSEASENSTASPSKAKRSLI